MPKGRNPLLQQRRNEMITRRYYYWREIQRRRRDDILEILANDEFFLDTKTVAFIIRQQSDLLKQLKKQQPDLKRLQVYTWDKSTAIVPASLKSA